MRTRTIRHLLGANRDDIPYGFTGLVGQAFNFPDDIERFNIRKLFPYNEEDIFSVINPFPERPRRLAIRGQRKYQTPINWRVVIDVWQRSSPYGLSDISSRLQAIEQKVSRLVFIESKIDLILEKLGSTDSTDSTDEQIYSAYFYNLL